MQSKVQRYPGDINYVFEDAHSRGSMNFTKDFDCEIMRSHDNIKRIYVA